MVGMSFKGKYMGRSRDARLARLARQAVQTPQTTQEELPVAEEVLLDEESIQIEEVIPTPVEPPKPEPVSQVQYTQRSPQNVLDSILAMLFQQHYHQIYKHMIDLENQIKMEQAELAEKQKVDMQPKTE